MGDADYGSSTPRPILAPVPCSGEVLSDPATVVAVQVTLVDSSTSEIIRACPSSLARLGPDPYTVATPDATVATSTSAPPTSPATYPALSASAETSAGRPSSVPQHAWVLVWTLPVTIHLGIVGLYLTHPKEAELPDILKILRLLEELGNLPHIIDQCDISLSELCSWGFGSRYATFTRALKVSRNMKTAGTPTLIGPFFPTPVQGFSMSHQYSLRRPLAAQAPERSAGSDVDAHPGSDGDSGSSLDSFSAWTPTPSSSQGDSDSPNRDDESQRLDLRPAPSDSRSRAVGRVTRVVPATQTW
ncbi:hypothetical protein FRC06_004720 [Ceratobasidium sp. 370]|nr:hypothetical protein FRC06_004720 [Ceratobasidium sp. 370]